MILNQKVCAEKKGRVEESSFPKKEHHHAMGEAQLAIAWLPVVEVVYHTLEEVIEQCCPARGVSFGRSS